MSPVSGSGATAFGYEPMVEAALREDLRYGDLTSETVVPADALGRGLIVAREHLVVSGLVPAELTFRRLDPRLDVEVDADEGTEVEPGTVVMAARGPLRSLLAAERTALNFLQRASGIATLTARYVSLLDGTGVTVLDTRKTAPGLRLLDKTAVRAGGGGNHRHALDDLIMIKDNHLVAGGGLAPTVEAALRRAGHAHPVEVEVDTLEQLDELLELPRLPAAVLLDNFTPKDVATAVDRIAGRMYVEVSGGITEETIRSYAEAGPDGISSGALTHSVRAADLGLDLPGLGG
ncbi:MAG: carboxylating nicotinate-nucleotide diphosphorylase [Acidobacteriota bacterium]